MPVMVFVAYYPRHKTTTRSLVCSVGLPTQTLALAGLWARGVLSPARDWPSLLATVASSAAGVAAGDVAHRRIAGSVSTAALLLFLSAASIEMLSDEWTVRLLCAIGLMSLAAATRYARSVSAGAAVLRARVMGSRSILGVRQRWTAV